MMRIGRSHKAIPYYVAYFPSTLTAEVAVKFPDRWEEFQIIGRALTYEQVDGMARAVIDEEYPRHARIATSD